MIADQLKPVVWHANCNTSLLVYPETKGVPLEEMDRVFGEGQLFYFSQEIVLLTQHLQTSAKKRWKTSLRLPLLYPIARGGVGSLSARAERICLYGAELG